MGDDQVAIDPEFRPPPRTSEVQRRRLRRLTAVAAVGAAFIFGWLFASPTATNQDGTDAADSTITTVSPATTSTTATLVAEPVVFASLDTPLAEEVPGFTDTIVMLATPNESFEVVRWPASSPTTERMISLERGDDGWGSGAPSGLDASGSWFAEHLDGGLLAVHGASPFSAEPESVGLRVESLVWHEADPGRIAWLACSRGEGSQTLCTLDVADENAEPVEVRSFENGCWGLWLQYFGNRGLVIGEPFATGYYLVDADGTETSIESNAWLVAEAPDGTTLWTRSDDGLPASFLTSPDGLHDRAVPGLAESETPVAALWSPDGASVALWLEDPMPVLRVVDSATGGLVTEVADSDLNLVNSAWAWSTDSRFLLYQRQTAASRRWALVFYDTATDTSTEVPLFDIVDEIRVTEPAFESLVQFGESNLEVDASGAAATGGTPRPDFGSAVPGDDQSERLPLGVVTEIPTGNRLDFLYERCESGFACYRDAVFVNGEDPSLVSAGWQADRPFHVRHGFINEFAEPLGDAFDVVLYVSESLGLEDFATGGRVHRYTSDYVLRGTADTCGPTYRASAEPVTCEWFVHEFADGLPAGRFALWAFWEAPCSAWVDYGFVETCTDLNEVMANFASGVDSPWEASAVTWGRG